MQINRTMSLAACALVDAAYCEVRVRSYAIVGSIHIICDLIAHLFLSLLVLSL